MSVNGDYHAKKVSPMEAAACVKSGDWVDFGMISNIPVLFDEALSKRKEELTDVKIRGSMAMHPLKIIEEDPEGRHFSYNSWHFSSLERRYADRGLCHYIPMNYSSQPKYYRDFLNVDVACICTSPIDRNGYFNFSLTNSSAFAVLENAKLVIIEVNEHLPRILGGEQECIHISDVDFIIEGEHTPFVTLPRTEPSEEDRKIAEFICPKIPDGAVLQLGIGGTPNAVGCLIADSDVKDLGMHTEMLCDAYLELFRCGKLTNRKKQFNKNKGVFSFCLGSHELYEWATENPGLASYPVDYTNAPEIIGRHEKMVAVNNCLQVDLFGQTCAETVGSRHISGTGGQLDFLYGSFLSKGGQGFLCMPSTYRSKETGRLCSRIVSVMEPGNVVTDPRSHGFFLVTEQGIANLAGCTVWERAEKIISLAHPDFREQLIRDAEKMKIWRRSNRLY